MKILKVVLTTLGLLLTLAVNSQEIKIELKGGNLIVLKIIDFPNHSKEILYNKTIEWLAYSFRDQDVAELAKIENQMIRTQGYTTGVFKGQMGYRLGLKYDIQFDIKDDKVRFSIYNLRSVSANGANNFSLEAELLKNGKLKKGKKFSNFKNEGDFAVNKIYFDFVNFINNSEKVNDW